MTIGFDGSRAFSSERTGTENYSYQLLLNLAKIDHENQYIVYIRPNEFPIESEITIKDFPANFQFKTINWLRFWTQGGLALQTFKDDLDLLFVPAHTLPLFRKPGLKTVMTVHDLGAQFLPSMHQLKQKLYLDLITKFQLKSATKLIAVSQATKKDLVNRVRIKPKNMSKLFVSKIEVIYEGINRKLFIPTKGKKLIDGLIKFDLKKDRYFLFVGTIQPRKNLVRLIEAFDKFSLEISGRIPSISRSDNQNNRNPATLKSSEFFDIKLVLVGSKGWMSDKIYLLPKKLGIEKKVKFLGHVKDQDLPVLYSGALALVYPSLFEGFGLPILEAFSCGCPVLTSNVSSMPEIAGDGAILINPLKIDEITDGMMMLKSGDIKKELVERGYKQVRKYSWEKCAKETLELFKKMNL